MNKLSQLHAEIDARSAAILRDNPDWLCRKGCDGCCRQLAEMPRLTIAEWDFLREGLVALAPERFDAISRAIAARPHSRPLVCPLLDQDEGACQVYAHRPVACRSYGFYVQRELGVYCKDIENRVVGGDWAEVVWGNHDAIDRRLVHLGETRTLTDWFEGWIGREERRHRMSCVDWLPAKRKP